MIAGIEPTSGFLTALASIVMIDLMLAGDNSVVIAMAVRNLPPKAKSLGIALGVAGAILVRVTCTVVVASLLTVQYLKVFGGALILWIAVKLITEGSAEDSAQPTGSIWRAFWFIIVADIGMGTDNMLAVAAASQGNVYLIAFGLVLSIPFIVFTSSWLAGIMDRYPIIVYIGAAILGKVGGEMMISDPAVQSLFNPGELASYAFVLLSTICVVAVGRYRQLAKCANESLRRVAG
jgi:YjbE family integral membrane protein